MMSTVAAELAGATAVIRVAELTVKLLAGVVPNLTALAPVKLLPVMTTDVPPVVGPARGLRDVTEGAAWYVNLSWEERADVPAGDVTVMSTMPAAWAGAITVIWVSESIVKLLAAVVPNFTAVAPVKLLPLMVTTVPAVSGPALGLVAVTRGST